MSVQIFPMDRTSPISIKFRHDGDLKAEFKINTLEDRDINIIGKRLKVEILKIAGPRADILLGNTTYSVHTHCVNPTKSANLGQEFLPLLDKLKCCESLDAYVKARKLFINDPSFIL